MLTVIDEDDAENGSGAIASLCRLRVESLFPWRLFRMKLELS